MSERGGLYKREKETKSLYLKNNKKIRAKWMRMSKLAARLIHENLQAFQQSLRKKDDGKL